MFILVALGFVVLTHMMLIGVVMMGLAAIAGVILWLTRPTNSDQEPGTVSVLPAQTAHQASEQESHPDRLAS